MIVLTLFVLAFYYEDFKEDLGITGKSLETGEQAILLRVIDGDTIETSLGKVRLLGINTPEKNMPHAESAKNFLKNLENKTLNLVADFEDRDKYARLLRYVFYGDRLINQEIIEKGFANTYYVDNLEYEQEFLDAERKARNLGVGIWEKSSEECAVENCILLQELNSKKEYFILKNLCDFSCGLEGWFVKDSGRNVFYLESLDSQEVRNYNSNKEVWNEEGDKFFIFDKSGKLVLFSEY